MSNLITIDKEYCKWIDEIVSRYELRRTIAVSKANEQLLRFYWSVGEDIAKKKAVSKWGDGIIATMSRDLSDRVPDTGGFSVTNLGYVKRFYELYSQLDKFYPQLVGNTKYEKLKEAIFLVPWGHHHYIIDKFLENPKRAFYYIQLTLANGWSRAMLLNAIDLDLKEPEGKAITNFQSTLPVPQGDLAQEVTNDPYTFDFIAITERYNEYQLKQALMENVIQFLLEMGRGFCLRGKEHRIKVGNTDQLIDLLFYNTEIHSYVVVEVKTDKFKPADIGQLGTYVAAANHLLRKEGDNPTIGLLICKTKDNVLAQYALESSSFPIGISEYELSKAYPADFHSAMPTIAEIESEFAARKLLLCRKKRKRLSDDAITEKDKTVIRFCKKPRSAEEIMTKLGLKNVGPNRRRYISRLESKGLLAKTIPGKATSKNQKYIAI
jgi:predicted nuclease of restriction endonuclease-like (RecB) superfamily